MTKPTAATARETDDSATDHSVQSTVDALADEDLNETPLRYSAYANRIRTLLLAARRYVAYTSDIGESFRPVAHPKLVTMGYAISWGYVLTDVARVCYKTHEKYPDAEPLTQKDWRVVGSKQAIFQGLASMALPAVTIHSTVRYSSLLFKNAKSTAVRRYGPVGLGLAVVPLLPYIFDEPVETAVDYVFDTAFA